MLLAQVFKTAEGALKRARFENAHCNNRYRYEVVRCYPSDQPDILPFDRELFFEYRYRLRRENKLATVF